MSIVCIVLGSDGFEVVGVTSAIAFKFFRFLFTIGNTCNTIRVDQILYSYYNWIHLRSVTMKVTIKDIAKMAGVSHPTVSKALNNEPGVSEETRTKILRIAKQVNYVPNLAAKMLTQHKTNSIGLIWPQDEGLFFYHLSHSIQKEALKYGVNVIMTMSEPAVALRTLNQQFVDMIIAWLPPDWIPTSEFLKEKELFPGDILVMGGGRLPDSHRISIDRKGGIYLVLKHFTELGHKRVAYIGEQSDKMVGYMQGVLEFGLEYHNDYVLINESDVHSNVSDDSFLKMINCAPKPTAVIIDSQGNLFKSIGLFRKYNIRIPEDLSMVVYDNIPEMVMFETPLTTVGPSIQKLAVQALSIYMETRDKATAQKWRDIEIAPEIVLRNSTK